jgi:hypothetical protein
MRVSETRLVAARLAGARHDADEKRGTAAQGRALVAMAPAAAVSEPEAARYRSAAFLAQLIANKHQLPQARERRRAEPGEAIAAYRAAQALTDN